MNYPPLTAYQRRFRLVCALLVLAGLVEVPAGSVFIVTGKVLCGAMLVCIGAAALGVGIWCWPTRWRNRLREIRDEWSADA